jgi:RHS repeat-associated protein
MRIEGLSTANPDNKFTYNGKELEDDHGLNWYHYGARFYDAQIGRWHVVDPVDQFVSPYVFVHNDPVNAIDRDGSFDPSTHAQITVKVMEKFGYSADAAAYAGKANAWQDHRQLPNSLHSMSNPFQDRGKAVAASQQVLAFRLNKAVTSLEQGKYADALSELGRGQHTIQDAVRHDFMSPIDHFLIDTRYSGAMRVTLGAINIIKDFFPDEGELAKAMAQTEQFMKDFESAVRERLGDEANAALEALRNYKPEPSEQTRIFNGRTDAFEVTTAGPPTPTPDTYQP